MSTNFENLLIRQEAENITLSMYEIFRDNRDFGFKDQIQRTSISIMNNIAEWYEKNTEKDKARYFYIAKWSCAEVRSMLHLWNKLWYISKEKYDLILIKLYWLNKMIYSFIKKFEI